MEREAPAKVVIVYYDCECGGEYRVSGKLFLDGDDVLFPHTCTKCEAGINLPEKYPTYKFKPV
ncbi:hypothetical protein [Vreelandella titanicae]|uniref:hypothetical protein n=1 Tax=Vreelandella titanicae TaxID=664683 RepID=UPI00381249B3